ncbi:transmembrane protein 131 [Anaeramoeba flamelloides]|uniref:Transmembrane protein 131 n=1 Tax=Anaeramoeba flamelloides TaxID=1746091 RepID=A0AAV7YM04_9EUKA|nr:transmembrane protein 131 [Anaeramoeba flamelloides]
MTKNSSLFVIFFLIILLSNCDFQINSLFKTRPNYIKINSDSRIVPQIFTFEDREICSLSDFTFILANYSNHTLETLAITSNSPEFFLENNNPQNLKKRDELEFVVFFNPKELGIRNGEIIIETNLRNYHIYISVIVVESSYNLKAIDQVIIGKNEMFSKKIRIYNPNKNHILHILDIIPENHDIILNAPKGINGVKELKQFWKIPPETSRILTIIKYQSNVPGTIETKLKIKTTKQRFLIPISINIISGVEIFPKKITFNPVIISRINKYFTKFQISILNYNHYPILINDINPEDSDLIIKNLNLPIKVPAKSKYPLHISIPQTQSVSRKFKGKITFVTNETNAKLKSKIEFQYEGKIIRGSLYYDESTIRFSNMNKNIPFYLRKINITSLIEESIQIFSAESDDPSFQVLPFTPRVIDFKDNIDFINVKYYTHRNKTSYVTELKIYSNCGIIKIPLKVYNGKLLITFPDKEEAFLQDNNNKDNVNENNNYSLNNNDNNNKLIKLKKEKNSNHQNNNKIDFEIFSVNEIRTKYLNLTNTNVISINIKKITTNLTEMNIKLESVKNSKGYSYLKEIKFDNDSEQKMVLNPGESAIFSLTIQSEEVKDGFGFLKIKTNYISLNLNIYYKCIKGDLQIFPQEINFGQSFPGKIIEQIIFAKNTFNRNLTLLNILSTDPRIITFLNQPIIETGKITKIGKVIYNPGLTLTPTDFLINQYNDNELLWMRHPDGENSNKLLLNQKLNLRMKNKNLKNKEILKPSSILFNNGLIKDSSSFEIINSEFENYLKLLTQLKSESNTEFEFNSDLIFHTDIISNLLVKVKASLTKPTILLKKELDFGLVQSDVISSQELFVYNPSDLPIEVKVFPFVFKTSFLENFLNEKQLKKI